MTRVTSGSRLHFGLFRLPPDGPWPAGQRYYGGVGLMVEEPAVRVAVEPATEWSASGPLASRALAFARLCTAEPHRVAVESCGPEHAGLGVGTQLGLAVGAALDPSAAVETLARRVERGRRSALGVHGFGHGGFLVDGGKRSRDDLAPLVARAEFPAAWRVILLTPRIAVPAWHGAREDAALAAAGGASDDALCRLVLLALLPTLAERDLAAFGDALFEFNVKAGDLFRAVQGGTYACTEIAALVAWLRAHGVRGAGQSSWGPTVFGVVGTVDEANAVAVAALRAWAQRISLVVTRGRSAPFYLSRARSEERAE